MKWSILGNIKDNSKEMMETNKYNVITSKAAGIEASKNKSDFGIFRGNLFYSFVN